MRARTEREQARNATDPQVAAVHEALAARYEALAACVPHSDARFPEPRKQP
jgi:hypothetical protein